MACGCLVITSNLGALRETMNNLNEYIDINIHNIEKDKYIYDFTNKLNNMMDLNENIKNILICC